MRRSLLCLFAFSFLGLIDRSAIAQDDDPRVAQWESIREQARDAFEDGDYATAERLFRQLLGDCATLGERSDWCVGFSKHWLAYTLDHAGRNEEAIEILKELAIQLRRSPDADPHRLNTVLSGIATISQEIGRYDDAIDAWNESCEVWAKEHGDDDFDLAGLYMALSEAQREAGRIEDASQTLDKAIAIYMEYYEADDEELVGVYQFAGLLAWECKRYDDAVENYTRVYEISKKANGERDSTALSALEWRGHAFANAGRLEDAFRDAERLHEIHHARYGDGHPEMFRYTIGPVRYAITLAQWDAAEDWLTRLERILETNDNFDNFDRRAVLWERWRFYERQGNTQKADDILSRLRGVLD